MFITVIRWFLKIIVALMGLCALVLLVGGIFKLQYVLNLPIVGTHPFLWALALAIPGSLFLLKQILKPDSYCIYDVEQAGFYPPTSDSKTAMEEADTANNK